MVDKKCGRILTCVQKKFLDENKEKSKLKKTYELEETKLRS